MISRRRAKATRSATPSSMRSGSGSARTRPIRDDLPFLLEDRLEVLPTFAVTLGSPGMWIRAPEFGVDFAEARPLRAGTRPFTRPCRRKPKLSRARGSLRSAIEDRAGERSSWSSARYPTPRSGARLLHAAADAAAAGRRRFRRRTAAHNRPRSSLTASRMRLRLSRSIRARR